MAAMFSERYERERDAWIAAKVAEAPPLTAERAAVVRRALIDTRRDRAPRVSRTAA